MDRGLKSPPSQALSKVLDTDVSAIGFSSASVLSNINHILPGGEIFNRTGRRTRTKQIRVRGYIIPTGTNVGVVDADMVRIGLVFDKQSNGVAPLTAGTIWGQIDSAGSFSTSSLAFANTAYRDRFLILREEFVLLPALAATGALDTIDPLTLNNWNVNSKGRYLVDFTVDCDLETIYGGSAGTIADISSGGLFVVAQVNTTLATGWQFTFNTRIQFEDV